MVSGSLLTPQGISENSNFVSALELAIKEFFDLLCMIQVARAFILPIHKEGNTKESEERFQLVIILLQAYFTGYGIAATQSTEY